ncbi:MAG: ankyrin repeat domain-containing protein [Bacteroidota bacterium]
MHFKRNIIIGFSILMSHVYSNLHGQTNLLDAIDRNDTALVERLLSHGANANQRKMLVSITLPGRRKYIYRQHTVRSKLSFSVRKRNTPLADATRFNSFSIVQQLLSHGADPNKRSNSVLTPLSWAAHNGNLEMVQLLLSHGAKMNRYEKGNATTPLIEAVQRKHLETARYLLNKEIEVDFADEKGMTALSHAAKTKGFEIVKLLIEKGADCNHRDKEGNSILDLACGDDIFFEKIDSATFYYLVDKGAAASERAFYSLCNKGQTDLAKALLDNGMQVKQNFILAAVRSGDLEFVKYLESTFNLSLDYYEPGDQQTALYIVTGGYAIGGGADRQLNIDLIKYILGKNNEINKQGYDRVTPLMNLFKYPKSDSLTAIAASLLIQNGAIVNCADSSLDYSTLMYAVSKKAIRSVKILVENGADVNFANWEKRTALSLACWSYDNGKVIQYLVEKGADINHRDKDGETPAMNLIVFARFENLMTLAELGADLNIRTNQGYTVLDLIDNEPVRAQLIRKGAKSGTVSK